MEYIVDEHRSGIANTGILVRAKMRDKWGAFDISDLNKESLLAFLRSRGGDNPWAEDCVGIILGHGHLYKDGPKRGTTQ